MPKYTGRPLEGPPSPHEPAAWADPPRLLAAAVEVRNLLISIDVPQDGAAGVARGRYERG